MKKKARPHPESDRHVLPPEPRPNRARVVAFGILLSKVFGLVRERVIAQFFGVGPLTDVFRNAMRAPNVLQNLLGEQTLSAAFIPIYSRLLAAGRRDDARRFAGAVLGLLLAAVSALVLAGVLLAPWIVSVLAAGFRGDAALVAAGEMEVDRFPLTVRAVRIIFPMTGFLVLAAWALGVLNSHRRFLVPYMSPIVWNLAIIAAVTSAAGSVGRLSSPPDAGLETVERWLFAAFFGALVGGILQFAVQLPLVWKLTGGIRPSLSTRVAGVRDALAAVGPAIAGRGVVQLSIYIDIFLANFLQGGAPAALGFAAVLINLPASAFGISIAAAELPELSRERDASAQAGQRMAERIERALRQAAFVVCPSFVGYLCFGFLAAGLLFRGGAFSREANWLVYAVLAGYTLGLVASTISRLLQNAFFALRDTRTPAKIAIVRLVVSAAVGAVLMFWFDRWPVAATLGFDPGPDGTGRLHFGALGLSLASSLGAWCELALLRRRLASKLPELRLPVRHIAGRTLLAAAAALPALALWWLLASTGFVLQAVAVLGLFVALYLGYAWWRRLPELDMWLGRVRR